MSELLLEIENLDAYYGTAQALERWRSRWEPRPSR